MKIKKLRKADENCSKTGKYLENAKNKALLAVKRPLFYFNVDNVGLSAVAVNLSAKLSYTVSLFQNISNGR